MDEIHGVKISTRDRVLKAWEDSMEMTRYFQNYKEMVDDGEVRDMFEHFADDEGHHAALLHEVLKDYEHKNKKR